MVITAAQQKIMKNHSLFNKIDVSFLMPFVQKVNIKKVIKEIERKIPVCLFSEVDIIYVGKFDFLDDDGVSSKNGWTKSIKKH